MRKKTNDLRGEWCRGIAAAAAVLFVLVFVAGCPPVTPTPNENVNDGGSDPQAFTDADLARGGSLYDNAWKTTGVEAPSDDHPFWSQQETNTRGGGDTWRCKECHGWDYKGAAGAYAQGSSHFTGFAGIFGTQLGAQEVFDLIKTDHGFGDAGLADDDIWDLAKFVLQGQIDTSGFIDADGTFIGDVTAGEVLYSESFGCSACHGADGAQIPLGADEPGVGDVARANAWETQHKIRFGQPATAMPAQVDATNEEVGDLGAYLQTLTAEIP